MMRAFSILWIFGCGLVGAALILLAITIMKYQGDYLHGSEMLAVGVAHVALGHRLSRQI